MNMAHALTVRPIAPPKPKDTLVIAGTGHRPQELGGYNDAVMDRLYKLAHDALVKYKPTTVISGMALGWDTALALAATDLKIRWEAHVPFNGQELKWPRRSQLEFHRLLKASNKVVFYSPAGVGYNPMSFHTRNIGMVDTADAMLALYNGRKSGGTYNCLLYASRRKRKVYNCWDEFMSRNPQKELSL